MTTPSPRLGGASHFANSGPSRSVLQKLLEEINGSDTPTALRDVDMPQGTRRPRSDSVWVAGGSMAQDARCKLRAADEARQRKLSKNNTNDSSRNETLLQPHKSISPGKITHSRPSSPELCSKPKRIQVMFDFSSSGHTCSVSDIGPTMTRKVTPTDSSAASPASTPSWLKPFHLIDDDRSIYMNVHGEDWKDKPLCLYCFRQHGAFHRVLDHGCEVCEREEILESHYWEPADGTY